MGQRKLTLFIDIISPFAYIAFYVMRHDAAFEGLDIEYVPVFLGGIMQDTGNRPPLVIKNKGDYVGKQNKRWLQKFNVPTAGRMPEPFPQPTIQTGRALCAIQQKYPAKMADAIDGLYRAFFVDLKPVGKPEVIVEILTALSFSKQEIEDVMSASQQPEFKQRLLDNTKQALGEGCFGLPYFVATNTEGKKETFWGFDHMGQVMEHLGLKSKNEGFHSML